MMLTSVALQVIANFADDYGDLASGLDNESRVGPKRGLQMGIITVPQMRRAMIGLSAVTVVMGVALVAIALATGPTMTGNAVVAGIIFVVVGLASVAAAMLYTMGKHPYGYVGLGDLMSFIFFGLVAVAGGSYLYLHAFTWESWLGSIALGLPVAGVMNVNNMRDAKDDRSKGKHTVANMLGDPAMRVYETVLLGAAAILFLITAALSGLRAPWGYVLIVASYLPWAAVLVRMWRTPNPERFDTLMKPTSMGTVLVALAFTLTVALG